jgi:hypothetical protein
MSHRAGLCGTCRHVRLVKSGRGSIFFLCRRSESDSRFPKYPPLPVRSCVGYEVKKTPDLATDETPASE